MGRGRGPVKALDAFLSTRESSLLAYAYAVSGGDAALAPKLLERALVKVFSRPPKGLAADGTEGRVREAVSRDYLSLDRRRRRWGGLKQLLRPHDWSMAAPTASSSSTPAVIDALRSLGPRERVCLLRYVLDEHTVEEIAHDFSLAPEKVRSCLHESLVILEDFLGPLKAIDPDGVPILTRSGP
jgi:DNA-directed RNA polymerase specialized sigma24 family protein